MVAFFRKPVRKVRAKPRPKAKARKADVKVLRQVARKRTHRQTLSAQAEAHWKLRGRRAKTAYLRRVREVLEQEGFKNTRLQWKHAGHAFGLIKDVRDKQIHVRVYENGVIDAEIEIHKRYLEHLWSPRPSAHREVFDIFRRHGIPIHFVNEHYLPQVGATRQKFPKRRTSVKTLVAGASAGLGIAGLYTARLILNRMKRGGIAAAIR